MDNHIIELRGNDEYSYKVYDTYVEIVNYIGNSSIVTIPESLDGLPVRSIGYGTFYENADLTEVTIPNSVTDIDGRAFYNCTNLSEIEIPDSVQTIDVEAFHNTPWLHSLTDEFVIVGDGILLGYNGTETDVVIPDTVKYIVGAFEGNYDIIRVTVPDTVTNIGEWTFKFCPNLTEVTIPDGVTSIGKEAFFNCDKLKTITIPDSVIRIGDGAFSICPNLTEVTIPNSVQTIGDGAFIHTPWFNSLSDEFVIVGDGVLLDYNGTGTDVVVPDTVKYISSAFEGNWDVVHVTIPNTVTGIGGSAFSGCKSLAAVTIPDSVASIGDSTFFECYNLTDVSIPSNVTNIGSSTFSGCTSLTDIALPSNVVEIGSKAFYECTNLRTVTIPDSVTAIGVWVFDGCNNLTILCPTGSYAETYASRNEIPCRAQ